MKEGEKVKKVQESRHSNGSLPCSEAELPLGKEIKHFLLISVGKVIGDKFFQPRQSWRGLAGGSMYGGCTLLCLQYPGCPSGPESDWELTTSAMVELGRELHSPTLASCLSLPYCSMRQLYLSCLPHLWCCDESG